MAKRFQNLIAGEWCNRSEADSVVWASLGLETRRLPDVPDCHVCGAAVEDGKTTEGANPLPWCGCASLFIYADGSRMDAHEAAQGDRP